MKNYVIAAGGSGVRVAEAMLQLCAAGLGPEEIKVLVIDPDASNGNYARTNEIFEDYQKCSNTFRKKLGDLAFFGTTVKPLAQSNGRLETWSPVDTGQVFRQILGNLTQEEKDVANLLFTESELSMPLKIGFQGHPALGAATLALLPLYVKDPVWLAVKSQIQTDLANDVVRVIVVGSVFGGTGASVFFPLARHLRELAKSKTDLRSKLQIGVIALTPYFTFAPGSADDKGPDARKFPIATQAAAQFYDHLRSQHKDIGGPATDEWPFDAMFWIGDDKPATVVYDAGGEKQKNKGHFIDLLAGLCCLDYFARPSGVTHGGACYFAGPKDSEAECENVTTWDDLPLLLSPGDQPDLIQVNHNRIKRGLLQFVLAGAMHIGFFSDLLENSPSELARRPTAIPWYYERFVAQGHRLDAVPHKDSITALSSFFRSRCFPWWRDVHASAAGRVRLFNINAFDYQDGPPPVASLQLRRLRDFLHGSEDLDADAVHRFFCDSCLPMARNSASSTLGDGAPAYLATLAAAAAQFIGREYKDKGV